MALVSPGVQVTIIDESFYTPAEPGTTPLIVVATAQDKSNGAGTGTATATTKANAAETNANEFLSIVVFNVTFILSLGLDCKGDAREGC